MIWFPLKILEAVVAKFATEPVSIFTSKEVPFPFVNLIVSVVPGANEAVVKKEPDWVDNKNAV